MLHDAIHAQVIAAHTAALVATGDLATVTHQVNGARKPGAGIGERETTLETRATDLPCRLKDQSFGIANDTHTTAVRYEYKLTLPAGTHVELLDTITVTRRLSGPLTLTAKLIPSTVLQTVVTVYCERA